MKALDGKIFKTKSGVEYRVRTDFNGHVEVSYERADGKQISMASPKLYIEVEKTNADGKKTIIKKLETRSQVIARLKRELGLA